MIQEKECTTDEIENAEIATPRREPYKARLFSQPIESPTSIVTYVLSVFSSLLSPFTMAKLLFLVALLVVASSVVAHTPPPSHPPPPPVHAPPLPFHAPPLPVHAPPLPVHAPPLPVHAPPPPKPVDTFSLKCVIHNIADRDVTFTLEVGKSSKKVVAKKGCWTAIAPVPVSCKTTPVVRLCVTVETNKGVSVTKSFPIHLLDQFKFIQPKSLKVLPLLAYRPKGGKSLEIEIDHKKILSFEL